MKQMFFLEFPCFFHDPVDVGNLISGSPAFCIFHYIFHYIQNNNFTVLQESQKFYYNYLLCALAFFFFPSVTKVGILLYRAIHQGIPNNQQLSMFYQVECSEGTGQETGTFDGRYRDLRASLVAQMAKNLPAMRETWVQSLGQEDPLEEGMATHSSVLAWKIPMDRGAWRATVHGVTKSWSWLVTRHTT